MICHGENWIDVEKDANYKMNMINSWIKNHKLVINNDKTVFITFSIRNDTQPVFFSIAIDKIRLSRVNEHAILGIFIDYYLRWEGQILFILYIFLKQLLKF